MLQDQEHLIASSIPPSDYARQSTARKHQRRLQGRLGAFQQAGAGVGGAEPIGAAPCPDPQLIGLYIANCAAPDNKAPPQSATLTPLGLNYRTPPLRPRQALPAARLYA